MKTFETYLSETPMINMNGIVIYRPVDIYEHFISSLYDHVFLPYNPPEEGKIYYHVLTMRDSSVLKRLKDTITKQHAISVFWRAYPSKGNITGTNDRAGGDRNYPIQLVFHIKAKRVAPHSKIDLFSFTSDYTRAGSYRLILIEKNKSIAKEIQKIFLVKMNQLPTPENITMKYIHTIQDLYKKVCEDYFKKNPQDYEAIVKRLDKEPYEREDGEAIIVPEEIIKIDLWYPKTLSPDLSLKEVKKHFKCPIETKEY